MISRLWLLLTLLPLVEIGILVWIGYQTTWALPLAWVLGTGLAGLWILRRHGIPSKQELKVHLASGGQPVELLLDQLSVMVAGVLLIVPGVLTDLAAMLLLVPVTRRWLRRYAGFWFSRRMAARFQAYSFASARQQDQIIDVHVVESASSGEARNPALEARKHGSGSADRHAP